MNDSVMMMQESKVEAAVVGVAQAIGMTLVGLCLIAAMAGLMVLVLAVAPNLTHRVTGALRMRGPVSFLIGIGVALILAVSWGLFQHVPGVNVLVAAVALVAYILALEASSEALGRKLALIAGKDTSRVSQVFWGWVTLAFASCVPIVGWFVILPYSIVSGMGAVLVGFFSRDEL
jgi:hypothetical protein